MNVNDLAPGATRDPAGFWLTPDAGEPSYPSTGNDFCATMEEESFWFQHRNGVITAAVRRHPPAGPIFDVGAGNAYVSAALERAGFPTIAIEPNRAGAANAIRRVSEVICGAFPSPAFRPGLAGGIALFDVLEHIEDDRGFLRSLRPYLSAGGRLYLTTPAYEWLWSRYDALSGHYRRYRLSALERVLREAGYRIDYATYFFWCLPVPILLFRTLRSRILWSDDRTFERARSQHVRGGKALHRLAESCFSFEVRRVARGKSIPAGGSCLVVASAET